MLLIVCSNLVQVPVNKACDAKAACCQGDTTQVYWLLALILLVLLNILTSYRTV